MNHALLRAHALQLCLAVLLPTSATAQSGVIVVSQVYGGGGNAGASIRNDFIEIFNRGNVTVDVTGWSVQYASASGSSWVRTELSGAIAPGQYYLVQEAQGSGGTVSLSAPDATGSIMMSATSGKVALVRGSGVLTGTSPSGPEVIDFVGYGDVNYSLGRPAGNLSNITAALRRDGGCTDSRNNYSDFAAGAPSPRNRLSARHACGAGSPPDVTPPSVLITQPHNGDAIRGTVTMSANATDNIGVVGVRFLVDGTQVGTEDTSPPYTISWDSTAVENGQHAVTGVARDAAGNSATAAAVMVTVRNEILTPEEVRPQISSVVNGASYALGPIAPGQLVIIFGINMGPAELIRAETAQGEGRLPKRLADTRVLVDGVEAPVFFTTATAVAAFAPRILSGADQTELRVEYQGRVSNGLTVSLAPSSPGLFAADSSGRGLALALHDDGTLVDLEQPAREGSVITLLATGAGATEATAEDGEVTLEPGLTVLLPVSVKVGGLEAPVITAEEAPGAIKGIIQIKIRVPAGLNHGGPLPLELKIGDAVSHGGVSLAIEGEAPPDVIETKLMDLRTNAVLEPLADVPHDRIAIPSGWLGLISWNIQTGGTSPSSNTRPPMVQSVLHALFGGSYQLLAAQEIPNAESSEYLRTLLPGGVGFWNSSFYDTTDSMDNGFYIANGVKLRDAMPLFVAPANASGRLETDGGQAEHPPQVAQFEIGQFDFTLITLHLTFANGQSAESVRELQNLLDYLDWYFDQPGHDPDVILCGDFNIPSALSGEVGKDGLTLDSVLAGDARFQTGERRFVVTVHEPTSRSPASSGGGPANNYDHCVISADTMEEFVQARRVDTTILTNHPDDPEVRLTSDHFPIAAFFRTEGPGIFLDNRPTIRRPQNSRPEPTRQRRLGALLQ